MTTKSVLFGARRAIAEEVDPRIKSGGQFLGSKANGLRDKAARRRGRSPLRRGFIPFAISPRSLLAIASLLAWFALSPAARAVSPPPDGGYASDNTAEGDNALLQLTTGAGNTAIGSRALSNNTTGGFNTANGFDALFSNTTGFYDTANGTQALFSNTTGSDNTANGDGALFSNTTGNFNTANGFDALLSNTTGGRNTAIGVNALLNNTTGSRNIGLGNGAGKTLTTGNDNIDIGNTGIAGDANIIRIGTAGTHKATFIAGIFGDTVASGVGVIVGSNGQLGTISSSARFKEAIKPMDKASEAILALKPVTFRYKHALDPAGIPQFGLVAEQVEKVNPDLVARDDQGKVNTVRYEAVNAMLLNEFLKQHRKVQELEAAIARQQKEIKTLAASLEEQALQIQKVSSQRGLSNPTPQTAAGG